MRDTAMVGVSSFDRNSIRDSSGLTYIASTGRSADPQRLSCLICMVLSDTRIGFFRAFDDSKKTIDYYERYSIVT
jgi:hypothetical protein